MKKKLLSLALALTLVFSLSAPALAAAPATPAPMPEPALIMHISVDPAIRDAWLAAHPDEAAAFDPHAWFQQEYPYYDSEEEYMETWDLETQADFETAMRNQWADSSVQAETANQLWTQTQAKEPEQTAQFLADFDDWFALYHSWYDSLEDYCVSNGVSEGAALYEFYEEWTTQREAEAQAQAERDAFITERGGVPGALNVMVNGRFLAFGEDEQPYAQEGITYVSADVLSEALGVTATAGADGYAPLRETAEAAGCSVGWDSSYNTAVVLSRQTLADELDRDFTVLNQLMAGPMDGKTRTTTGKLTGSVTVLNSLDGDTTYRISGKSASSLRDGSGSASLSLDLSSLAKFPGLAELANTLKEQGRIDDKQFQQLAAALMKPQVDVMLDRENGMCYFRSPLLACLYPDALGDEDWVSMELTGDWTMGSFAAYATASSWDWYTSVHAWDNAVEEAQILKALLGDQRFTASGKGWDYKLDPETMTALFTDLFPTDPDDYVSYYNPYANMDWSKLFQEFDVKLHLEPDGAVTGSYVMRPNYGGVLDQALPGVGSLMNTFVPMLDFRTEATFSRSGSRQTSKVETHYKNTMKYELTATAETKITDKAPDVAPGKDEKVLTLDELLFG